MILLTGYISILFAYPVVKETQHTPARLPTLLPAWVIDVLSLGQSEAVAELIFFQVILYSESREAVDRLPFDLDAMTRDLNIATKLDPYNMDCYYFAQAMLGDKTDTLSDLNDLLERGLRHRTWDYYLPFFLGANYYFVLKDRKKAADYFAEAARRRPESPLFSTLAARVYNEADCTEYAILFLRQILQEASSPVIRDRIRKRLQALETVCLLEQAVSMYEERFKALPTSMKQLLTCGILREMPPDPYGGEFYLDNEGTVYTTSKFVDQRTGKNESH